MKPRSLDRGLVEHALHMTAVGALQREEPFLIASSEPVTVTERARRQQLRHLGGDVLDVEGVGRSALL